MGEADAREVEPGVPNDPTAPSTLWVEGFGHGVTRSIVLKVDAITRAIMICRREYKGTANSHDM